MYECRCGVGREGEERLGRGAEWIEGPRDQKTGGVCQTPRLRLADPEVGSGSVGLLYFPPPKIFLLQFLPSERYPTIWLRIYLSLLGKIGWPTPGSASTNST